MIVAVEEALRLGTCDGGAMLYIFREPDELQPSGVRIYDGPDSNL